MPSLRADQEEARISLDVKEADVVDVVRMLAELAGFQVVLHPGISCKLTLKLSEVSWTRVLDVALRSCNLGREEDEGVLRVAPTAQLVAEAEARRKLEEARAQAAPRSVTRFGLSYARAREMAPALKKMLGPRAEVVWDERTNTLIIID